MSNWALPTLTSTYANFLSEVSARLDDSAKQNRLDTVTLTSPPTGLIRWNTTTFKWEGNTGTPAAPVWTALATTYDIKVTSATKWATARTVAMTGDATATAVSLDGSANISLTSTLATVNANVGAFGSATAVPVITVNAKGLVTAVSTAALGTIATQAANSVAITGGAVSATALTLVQSTTAAPTVEGRVEWDTDGDTLMVGTGAATKTFAPINPTSAVTVLSYTMSTGCTWGGTAIPVANGGTNATNAATARTNLGIGTIATQASTAVSITGGAVSGTALTLVQSTTAAPTVEGRVEWDTDNDLLVVGNGTASKVFAPLAPQSQVTAQSHTFSTGCTWNGNGLTVPYGGTGVATITGLVYGNAAAAMSAATAAQVVSTIGATAVQNATTAAGLSNTSASWLGTAPVGNVVGMLAWKNFGNGHVIFDASSGLSPSGSAVNASNSTSVWQSTYPTLMGWNGSQTYGVRVDSARIADTAGTAFAQTLLDDTSASAMRITIGADVYKTLPSAGANLVSGEMYVATTGFTVNTGLTAGNVYPIYNNSASAITITQGSGVTLRLAGTATTGNRTLSPRGMASLWCLSTTEYIISGVVLS